MAEDFSGLLLAAKQVACQSYTPVTHHSSGAALLSSKGSIFTGCALETSNFSSSICAAKAALAKAISAGEREFIAIAVSGSGPDLNYLCGDCRQAFAEFSLDLIVISETAPDEYIRLAALLPV